MTHIIYPNTNQEAHTCLYRPVREGFFLAKMEEWKSVTSFNGYFEVSNKGRIRSVERLIVRSGLKPYILKSTVLKQYKNTQGYSTIRICVNNIRTSHIVHRLVAKAFIPNPNNKPQVNHINSKRHDNYIENLEWVTASENAIHGFKYGNRVSPNAR